MLVMEAIPYRLEALPAGEAGTDATLSVMRDFVSEAQRSPYLRDFTVSILRSAGVDSRDERSAALAVYNWISTNIAYVLDPLDVETVQAPRRTIETLAGDCDDQATLVAAMLAVIGIGSQFRVTGPDPQHFDHVYTEARIGYQWMPLDTTNPHGAGIPSTETAEKIYPAAAGLAGIFDDIWGAIKKTGQDIIDNTTVDGNRIDLPDIGLPDIVLPEGVSLINTEVKPETLNAAVSKALREPLVIAVAVLAGVVIYQAVKPKRGR